MTRITGLFVLMALLGLFAAGCSKKDEGKAGAGNDSAMTLPDQPPLPPVEDEFQEPDSVPEAAFQAEARRPAHPDRGLTPGGPYVLQVALLSTERKAVRHAEKLKKEGIPAYVASVVDPTPELPGTYYRVRVGAFATTAAARAYAAANLEPLGIRAAWPDLKARDSEPIHPVYAPKPPAPTPAPAPAPAAPVPQPVPVPIAPVAPVAAPVPQPVAPPVEPAPEEPAPAPAAPAVEDW